MAPMRDGSRLGMPILAGAFVLALAAPALAQDAKPDPKRLYMTKTCVACHGKDGKKAIQDYPDLAGQRADYIAAQIKDIMEGKRTGSPDSSGNPRSKGMRGALIDPTGQRRITDEEITAISQWLAAQEPRKPEPAATPLAPDKAAAAGKLYQEQCEACHGAKGNTPQDGFPVIAGQKRAYLLAQVKDIKAKARTNGQAEAMLPFVEQLSDEQIELLADFISQLDPTAK